MFNQYICITTKQLFLTVVITALLATTGCDFSALNKDLPTILGRMQDDKNLVEAFVHDLKQVPATKDVSPQLDLAESQYVDACAAQQAYFSALRIAVSDGRKQIDLDPLATEAETKTAAFVQTASNILLSRDHTQSGTRGLSPINSQSSQSNVPRTVVTFPHEITADFGRIPNATKTTILDDVQRRTTWKSWPDL